jgi:hypothetical protein
LYEATEAIKKNYARQVQDCLAAKGNKVTNIEHSIAKEVVPITESKAAGATPVSEPGITENVHITNSILGYLQSEPGSKLANEFLAFFQDWKNQHISHNKHTAYINAGFQIIILCIVLGTATVTTIMGKMDPVLAGLLGTLAGYVLGRKSGEK